MRDWFNKLTGAADAEEEVTVLSLLSAMFLLTVEKPRVNIYSAIINHRKKTTVAKMPGINL